MITITYIIILIASICPIILGIIYLTKTGWYYRKMIEKKSEEFARNIGIALVIIGFLLFIISIYELFIKI